MKGSVRKPYLQDKTFVLQNGLYCENFFCII
jgi:hypothetical protein